MDPTNTAINLSPFVFTAIQNIYIQNFSLAFNQINHYAIGLFYLLATIEICLFGIIWALKQQEMLGLFIFKIIKLAFVFFIISNYSYLLNSLVNGLAQIGLSGGNTKIATIIFSPDLLWHFGFDSSISLLTLAVQYGTANIGMSFIYLVLGFGIMFMFALIACQIILLVVGFYLLALMALVFLPFGTFVLSEKLFTRSIHALMQAAVRIFGLIVVLGVGIGIWMAQSPGAFGQNTTLDQPLGLFMATLVITLLCWKVPALLAASVGEFGGELFNSTSGESASSTNVNVASAPANISQTAAASNMGGVAGTAGSQAGSAASMSTTAAGANVSVNAGGAMNNANLSSLNQNLSELTKAVKVQKAGVSRETLNKLKSTFRDTVGEK